MHPAETRIIAGHEAMIVYFYAEVERLVASDHLPRIARRTQILSNKFVLPDLIGSGYFDRSIYRFPTGYFCHRGRDIIRRHRLHKNR